MYKAGDLIILKIKKIFPDSNCEEVLSALASYGEEKHEKEKYRVRLAILKLCEEENLNDPTKYVKIAKIDYRDVIAWAEYPNQLKYKNIAALDSCELQKLKNLDEEQYREWLNRV